MIRAVLYLRSSKDRNDVSIDAQRRELKAIASKKGYVVVGEFADAVERADDWDRPGFAKLLNELADAKRSWKVLIVLDTSRLARDNELLGATIRHECKKRGVTIEYAKFPSINPMNDLMVQSVDQLFARLHSMMSREKGLAGMAENVRKGWRAGGRAPRGYRLHYEQTGAVRDGEPVTKSKLVPGDDALQARAYLGHRARGIKRSRAMELAGVKWPITSLIEMERNALVYAGFTVWNRAAERTDYGYIGGEKWRPRSEWVIQKGTHEPLISEEDAEIILAALAEKKRGGGKPARRIYLLAGLLVAPDGTAWHGDGGTYRLGKGLRVQAENVEHAVLAQVTADLQSEQLASRIAEHYRQQSEKSRTPDDGALKRRLAELDRKTARLADLLGETTAQDALLRQIEAMETERADIVERIKTMEEDKATTRSLRAITASDVQRLLRGLAEDMNAANPVALRDALQQAVERVELSPDTFEAVIHLRLGPASKSGVWMASPRDTVQFPAFGESSRVVVPHSRRRRLV